MAIRRATVAISFEYTGNPPVIAPKTMARMTMKEKLETIF